MKKIKSEFFTEKEAISAMDKIKPYCGNVRIIFGENYDQNYIPDEYDFDFPRMNHFNALNCGGFGMNSNWYSNSYHWENQYKQNFYRSEITRLEIDVSDDHYEYVKNILYSCGAMFIY